MPSLATLNKTRVLRIMIAGYPGTGKTGALACLANAGYNLRILDFDHNLEPLNQFVAPEALDRVEIVSLEDKMKLDPDGFVPVGKPEAFTRALRLLDNWKYTLPDGTEVDLGPLKDWGPKDILVIDSLTTLGEAAFRHVLYINNRKPNNIRQADWGSAMTLQNAMMERATSPSINCHVIVLAHLKMIGPKDIAKDDTDLTRELKERVAEVVPTKLFPAALGQVLPPIIGGHFPTLLLAETIFDARHQPKRIIRTTPKPEIDLKIPTAKLPAELPQDTGLLTVFNELLRAGSTAGAKEAA